MQHVIVTQPQPALTVIAIYCTNLVLTWCVGGWPIHTFPRPSPTPSPHLQSRLQQRRGQGGQGGLGEELREAAIRHLRSQGIGTADAAATDKDLEGGRQRDQGAGEIR